MLPLLLLVYVCLLAAQVYANVEKVVFVAPSPEEPANIRLVQDTLASPYLERLSPLQPSLRRRLHARFPSSIPSFEQSEVWIRLDGLQPGCRYDIRVCWSATVGEADLDSHPSTTEQSQSNRRTLIFPGASRHTCLKIHYRLPHWSTTLPFVKRQASPHKHHPPSTPITSHCYFTYLQRQPISPRAIYS